MRLSLCASDGLGAASCRNARVPRERAGSSGQSLFLQSVTYSGITVTGAAGDSLGGAAWARVLLLSFWSEVGALIRNL